MSNPDIPNMSIVERLLGVSDATNPNTAMAEAYHTVIGEPTDRFADECQRLDDYDAYGKNRGKWDEHISLPDQENIIVVSILRQLFIERDMRFSNLLKNGPMFQRLYTEYGESAPAVQSSIVSPRKALLVGCETALSMAAFVDLSRYVYGQADPHAVDLTSSHARARHGTFKQGDIFDLSAEDGQFDIVQSDNLMYALKAPGLGKKPSFEEHAPRVYEKMHQVMKKGGQLMMHEVVSGLDDTLFPIYATDESQQRIDAFPAEIHAVLEEVGFSEVVVEPASGIRGVDHFFDPDAPASNFANYEFEPVRGMVVVSASKR